MKKMISVFCLMVLLCTACTSPGKQSSPIDNTDESSKTDMADSTSEPIQNGSESILSSYYLSKSSPAFEMLNKSIFKNLLDDWIGNDIENPIWNYDSFTRYHILNHELEPVNSDSELYYCTYSADNSKYGYIVMSYDGSSLERINAIETLYSYDLQASIDEIMAKLGETDIDLTSAAASRVQIIDTDETRTDEVILFTDDNGNNYACYLDSLNIVKIQP